MRLRDNGGEKPNQNATHVELLIEGLRTRVQFPPAPPYRMTEAANDIQLAAFFIGKSMTYLASTYKDGH